MDKKKKIRKARAKDTIEDLHAATETKEQ